ncbi:lipocalin-like domain-containing protein, partial [Hydrogenophaga sp.]|uniref:lipocalin-like domain-containing protein n=1 Tax=Hydrogenophaga sp. TaxID=1904254 RepID=UPI003564F1D6
MKAKDVPNAGRPNRRQLLGLAGAFALPWRGAQAQAGGVLTPRPLSFPQDHGAHTDAHTEWWYLTGDLSRADGRRYGFQVTFFRRRLDATQALQSRLAAKQLLLAHAAITDVQEQRNWHDQRLARWNGQAYPLPQSPAAVYAATTDTEVVLRDWRLERHADGGYTTEVQASDFGLSLGAQATQPLLLQGEDGFSRKGPEASQASFYYSQPQLAVQGRLRLQGQTQAVTGRAWLDHEWSESLLHPDAVGWDWVGMNLQNGDSLTAFRLRRADGSALWAGGSYRSQGASAATGRLRRFGPDEVVFAPLRFWTSPLTQTRYPVAWRLRTPSGDYTVKAVIDAQELDSRQSTGAVYWEGLS